MRRLVVVSNRVGPLHDGGKAGGLAVGLGDALRTRGGIWFGWSGEKSDEGTFGPLKIEDHDKVRLATIDLTPEDAEEFYGGYANQTLWPLLHYRLDLANFDQRYENAYRRVNERMAARLTPQLQPGDMVWVHDYHYIVLGERLRESGFTGPLAYFLHVPFPSPEIMTALPNSQSIVRSLTAYDVIGFQTDSDRRNFARYVVEELGGRELPNDELEAYGRTFRASTFPIGIDTQSFAEFAVSDEAQEHEAQLKVLLRDRHQIIGVDRLDYSKGIPERFRGFERLLEDYPENRGRVSLMQVAPLSRSDLEAYSDLRSELEELAGHINGAFSALDWVPIRIMTRGFTRRALAGIYRASRVGLVTPLRDGMNLVAKEYVAAQNPDDPGVLVLSRFAGAVKEMPEALIVNPYDTASLARALQQALNMSREERKERWQAMFDRISKGTAQAWCDAILKALEERADKKVQVRSAPTASGKRPNAVEPKRARAGENFPTLPKGARPHADEPKRPFPYLGSRVL
ncbi:alpha,alpha-trehalose-phosphate synthase (UDP-forming) [Afifella marina]|uniref:Trehalose 6-phosphate synthase n=1 Tax=Afifella marina DSM 2698 TaxID=1120955 RepID=A0A1G5NT89_AFIMA|nr:trehalose-6-phosphate synthase [Afifella marina]MBK1624797.1 trehalose-6-phosphate synthase [Afifella marina DSM 2698]MBK1628609.1 trehalose-6-phosphate synthase [Afifella marina]MBK5915968.1 trehalose-6-phosphate synthase [Afifella marina]RAI20502.1 trehalose-6-phosphate synthase [Afifella marina DSM 2698]SCZ39951.1 trehalose 6-phosphate synthase [Afifella marina DSM 2698]